MGSTVLEGGVEFVIVGGVAAYSQAVAGSLEFPFGNHQCRVLGLDALISAKEALGRPHDLESAVQLRAIRERIVRDT